MAPIAADTSPGFPAFEGERLLLSALQAVEGSLRMVEEKKGKTCMYTFHLENSKSPPRLFYFPQGRLMTFFVFDITQSHTLVAGVHVLRRKDGRLLTALFRLRCMYRQRLSQRIEKLQEEKEAIERRSSDEIASLRKVSPAPHARLKYRRMLGE